MNLPFVYFACYLVSLTVGYFKPELSRMLHIVNIVCLGGILVSGVLILWLTRDKQRKQVR